MRRAAPRSAENQTIRISLGVVGLTLAFTGCPDVAAGLETILRGWKVRRLPSSSRARPSAQVIKTAAGYRWRSARLPKPALWDKHPPASAMSVINDIHDVFFDWFLERRRDYLCLHGAAVRIGDGLICFPSTHHAGKSTLAVKLASSGAILYCDDVLPIEPRRNRGMAMGIAPLLRKPLPPRLGSPFLRFVEERPGPSDRRWLYVRLNKAEIAPFGEDAPIKALVLLQRNRRGEAGLRPLPKQAMLKEIILQNFARRGPPVEILDRLLRITRRADCYRLHYSRLDAAARTITAAFGKKSLRAR
jgi:hypothetical protein